MVPERTHARANPARGIALIATAVVVGYFLLRNGWDQNAPDVTAATAEEAPAEGGQGAPPAEGEPTASTTPIRQPGEVMVRVFNTTAVNGAARAWTDQIQRAGYQIIEPAQAQGIAARDTTAVLFTPGFDREAGNLATQIGAPPGEVAQLPDPPPADPGGAQVVVLLGADIAEAAG
jgi:LytR cell envelope-related transcriptional attenuator